MSHIRNEKKTILHILNTGEYSGAENVVVTIIKNYPTSYRGIYMSRKGSIADVLDREQIEYYGVDQLSVLSIQQAVKSFHPDIIHAHDFTASILAAIAVKDIPIISHLHNNVPWMKHMTIRSLLYRMVINKITDILVVSDSVVEECWYKKIMRRKSICMGNPIDLRRIRAKKTQEISTQLLFVGRLTEQKSPLEFLSIVDDLVHTGCAVTATMLGRGELEDECRTFIKEKKLEQVVTMKGFVENPYDYMTEGAVLVLPSQWEGFGLVAVEALCFGVPVVANPVGGLPGIVDESCGCLTMNHEEKVTEIRKLYNDFEYYLKKSMAAKKRAIEIENINIYMMRLEKVYSQNRVEE